MILFKLIGVTLVITGFGAWGLLGARRIEKRVEQIKSLRLALGFLEKEITYNYTPLTQAMERTYRFSPIPVSYIFRDCALALKDKAGITAKEAWTKSLENARKYLDLKHEDLELVLTASSHLGMSDVSEQRKFFALIQEELKIQEEKAIEEVNSGRKLWSYGGFILGAVVVLLLV